MALRYANFQPVKKNKTRHSFAGALAVAAVAGMIVRRKAGSEDTLELADGTTGYFLRQDVVADNAALKAFLDADILRPQKGGFRAPVVAGGVVQCEHHDEVWVEGSALLDAAMDGTITVETPLTTKAGKWFPLADSTADEVFGIVRQNIAAKNGAGRRFLIEVIRNSKVVGV